MIQLTCYIVVSYLYSLKLFVKWDMQSSLLDMSNFLDNLDFYLGQILFLYSSKIGTIFDPKILLDIGAKFDIIKKNQNLVSNWVSRRQLFMEPIGLIDIGHGYSINGFIQIMFMSQYFF